MGFIRGFYYFWGECDWKKDDPSVRPGPHQCLSNREPRVCMFCDQLEGTEMDKLSEVIRQAAEKLSHRDYKSGDNVEIALELFALASHVEVNYPDAEAHRIFWKE